MARIKISEYTAKKVLIPNYHGVALSSHNYSSVIRGLPRNLMETNLVIKVDQGIKKRGKQGLVKVNVTVKEVPEIIKNWEKLGWSNFLIEPVIEHDTNVEHYLALERVRDGWQISYSEKGGIDVESSWDLINVVTVPSSSDLSAIRNIVKDRSELSALESFLKVTLPLLDSNHISFLEMNPVLIRGDKLVPLDMACEVDDAGSSLLPVGAKHFSPVESQIQMLDASTPASLKFKLLNPDGSIWVFLSGGGASLVIADEVADLGLGHELANYGEYSGSPSDDDVYSYAKIILSQLLSTTSHKPRAIIIAGGVANFTDVVKTFRGLIRALDEKKEELVKAKVKIFVRRGGPNEAKGLAMMQSFLEKSDLLGSVHGHDIALTQVVTEVKNYLKEDVYPKRTVLKRNSRLQAEKGSSADERTVLTGIQNI